jgi:hypothetical protein
MLLIFILENIFIFEDLLFLDTGVKIFPHLLLPKLDFKILISIKEPILNSLKSGLMNSFIPIITVPEGVLCVCNLVP